MANQRLRQALTDAGLTFEKVAAELDVDPKTVERWVTTGRIPYPRLRERLADLVGIPVLELWPQVAVEDEQTGLDGDWWAAWQSSKDGAELVASQPIHIDHYGGIYRWAAVQRGRPSAQGGYMWSGEMRLWDREVLMGWYVSTEELVRNKGTVFLRLHPSGRLMAGRWTGMAWDGWVFSGWGVLAREEAEARSLISDLMGQSEPPWMRSSM